MTSAAAPFRPTFSCEATGRTREYSDVAFVARLRADPSLENKNYGMFYPHDWQMFISISKLSPLGPVQGYRVRTESEATKAIYGSLIKIHNSNYVTDILQQNA